MSYQLVLERLQAVEQILLEIQNNDKSTDEFSEQNPMVLTSKIRVYNNGASQWIPIESIVLASQGFASIVENHYDSDSLVGNDIAAMLSDQGAQTQGRVQYVEDASADPDITSGYAYYEKLEGNTATLADDYRRLSKEEVAALQVLDSYRNFNVKAVSQTPGDTVVENEVDVEIDGSNNITGIVFDERFTDYLAGYAAKSGTLAYYLKIFNKTQKKVLIAKISGFTYTTGANAHYQVSVDTGMVAGDIAADDQIEVFIDIDIEGSGGSSSVDTTNTKIIKPDSGSTAGLQSFAEQIDGAVYDIFGTEVVEGGEVAINADNTKFDIVDVLKGYIKSGGTVYKITGAIQSAVSVTTISASSTYLYYDTAGALQQQTTAPTVSEWESKLFFARLASNGTNLVAFERMRNPSGHNSNLVRLLYNYAKAAGVPFYDGFAVTPNANLTFQRAAGTIFGIGTGPDSKKHIKDVDPANPANLFVLTRSTTVSSGVNNVNVTQWDNNDVLDNLANNNTWAAHPLLVFDSGNHVLQLGQYEYSTKEEAINGTSIDPFVYHPSTSNGEILGWWIIKKNATDLSDSAEAVFRRYTIGGSSAAAAAGALLASNNLSDLADAAIARANLGVASESVSKTEYLMFAVSDEDSDLAAGTGKLTFRMPYGFTLSGVRANVKTAPTGSTLIIDINEGGTTILSTKLSIDGGEKTSTTAATAAVISDTALADDSEITIDIDQIGSTAAGTGLKLTLIGTRT